MASSRLQASKDLPICTACGTQYPDPNIGSCRICLDPRQFVPPTGQAWTSLSKLRSAGHHNAFERDPINPHIWSIWTEPKFAIGQRAMLLQTPHGNILWDMIAFLDAGTISRFGELGGLAAIVISHPHYYTTMHDWLACFPGTPMYIGAPDKEWLVPTPSSKSLNIHFLTSLHTSIIPGVLGILSGGHFPGSLCLHWDGQLFIADTIFTVPSARNPTPGEAGQISYTFWYSVPNRIPLSPSRIWDVWESVKDLEWHSTFGAFRGMDVRTTEEEVQRGTGGVKGRLLESVRIFVRQMGWVEGQEKVEWTAVGRMLEEETRGSEAAPASKGEVAGMETEFEL